MISAVKLPKLYGMIRILFGKVIRGRKPLKPNYDAAAILQEQMEAAVALYTNNSLQTIADTLSLNLMR